LPYRTKTKKAGGVVLTLMDITNVKRAEHDLAEAVRRRDEFLAMLSHELRNPLGAILNGTHVMDRLDIQDPALREICDVIKRQAQQISRLLDDLLDVSRVTQNKIELHIKPTDVRSIVRSAVESVRPTIEAADLRFTEEIAAEPMTVNGDAARLQQALSNLLANAAKYTPDGGDISLEAFAEDGEVVFRVRDTGVGIPSDKLEAVFDLFVQSDHTLDRSDGGMGIGLTLVRSIVEMHNGRVVARSEGPGLGSEFELRLPRIETVPSESRESEDGTYFGLGITFVRVV
jgi:two-component system, chemotaxis family, CheB/CheR fusion protein